MSSRSLDDALRRLRPQAGARGGTVLSIPSDYGVALAGDVIAKAEGAPVRSVNRKRNPEAPGHDAHELSRTLFRPQAANCPTRSSPPLAGAAGDRLPLDRRKAFSRSLSPTDSPWRRRFPHPPPPTTWRG